MGHLENQGIKLCFETSVESIQKSGERLSVKTKDGKEHKADQVMFATGRRPHTRDLGLEACGINTTDAGFIEVNEFSQTNIESIYALGDCTERPQLTPVAIRDAQAFADTVYGGKSISIDHTLVPTAVFSKPPVGTVGLSEADARKEGEVDIYKAEFRPMFHTLSGRDEKILMKLIVEQSSQKVLGFHMVGPDAPEIAQATAIAMRMGATKDDFDRTIALHPTTAEELVLMRTKAN
jgi:glutathione reductase (NADPH)